MLAVREDLRSLLLGSTDVEAAVADRIYPAYAPPKGSDFPYVTYIMTSAKRPHTHDEDVSAMSKADRYEFVVSVWDTDADRAVEIAEDVDIALNGKSATNAFVFLYDDATEIPVLKEDGSGQVITQVAINVIAVRRPQ